MSDVVMRCTNQLNFIGDKMTVIKSCNCAHKFQDEKYGKGQRVKNETTKKKGIETVYRCTVCKSES